jgi:nicotinic acid mononucleotide adenylyltransferase
MSSSDNNIVFSFQGAFGPPTWGHYTSMKLFAIAVLSDYSDPHDNITMLFMPTAKSSSKPHLEPTQVARTKVLQEFCRLLQQESEFVGQRIKFDVSAIEYELAKSEDPRLKSGTTIVTIEKIIETKQPMINSETKILLGMGFDNMMQLPYWAEVDKFVNHVAKIYVSYRTLSPEEIAKTNVYTITKDVSDEKPKLRFDTTIPGFFKVENLPIVIQGFDLPDESAPSIDTTQKAIDSKSDHEFHLQLPSIKVVGKTDDDTSQIPATSSSMMRYFINNYIQASRNKDVATMDQYKQKIKNVMFGSLDVSEIWEKLFSDTIQYYDELDKNYKNYKKIFPEEAKGIEYEKQYTVMFHPDSAAVAAPGGGARSKKTKRRKGRRNSRSKTRKRRLTNKRSGNRRRNRTHH